MTALVHEPDATASPPSDEYMKNNDSNEAKLANGSEKPDDNDASTDLSLNSDPETGDRKIGKWRIKETLGKGGYSWVKRGIDCESNKVYALKFIERRYETRKDTKTGKSIVSLRKSQIKQVETEIEVLRRIGRSSDNIIRLFAYNLNQKYPDRNGKTRDVILLVLEYAPGGELFDLLYYTDVLEPILARSYFHQLCSGVQCLHVNGIIHRDIKPQNLLLDEHYNLKITDFGLSKIVNAKEIKDGDMSGVRLTNSRCGTKGYQAPELVLMNAQMASASGSSQSNQQQSAPQPQVFYNNGIDVFAMGVVLFILMTRYPPFKEASSSDKWYKYIADGDYQTFWRAHRNSGLKKAETDLITRMLLFDSNKRIKLDKIMQHPWYTDEVLTGAQLEQVLTYRHQEMQLKRSTDDTKQSMLRQPSDRVRVTYRPLLKNFEQRILAAKYTVDRRPPVLPPNVKPNMIRDVYTVCNAYEVLQEIKVVIEDVMKGHLIASQLNEVFDIDEDDDTGDDAAAASSSKKEPSAQQGKGDIDIDNFCLTATIAHLKTDDDEDDDEKDEDGGGGGGAMNLQFERIKLHVQLYWDEQNEANLVQFNIVSETQNDPFSSNDFWQRKRMMDQWRSLKNHFLTKAEHVLTGLKATKQKHDDEIQELYKKCFTSNVNKKD